MREINQKGLNLLKQFEGCRLQSYKDIGGIWTIGYGETGPTITGGMFINLEQAELMLKKSLEKFYQLDHYLSEDVNDNQYSALVCLAYNIGLRALKTSTLIKKINNKEKPDKEWLQFNHVNGKVIDGLTRRRKAELELFNTLED